jgi:hypothetical protein
LELARGNSAVEILARLLLVVLPTADHELTFLNRDIEFVAGEPRDRKRNAQPFRPPIFTRHPLDIVRRVPVSGLSDTIERSFDFIEAKQKRAR